MANLKDYQAGRNDGLAMALEIVERAGVDELRKEIKFRAVAGIHTALATKELNAATQKIKEMTLDTMLVLSVAVLHDEFGFGQQRVQRFIDRMEAKSTCLVADMCTWQDYIEAIKDEIGIELQIRVND